MLLRLTHVILSPNFGWVRIPAPPCGISPTLRGILKRLSSCHHLVTAATQNNTENNAGAQDLGAKVCAQRVLATHCYIKNISKTIHRQEQHGATKRVTLLFAGGVKLASKQRGSLNLLPLTSTGRHVSGNWCNQFFGLTIPTHKPCGQVMEMWLKRICRKKGRANNEKETPWPNCPIKSPTWWLDPSCCFHPPRISQRLGKDLSLSLGTVQCRRKFVPTRLAFFCRIGPSSTLLLKLG